MYVFTDMKWRRDPSDTLFEKRQAQRVLKQRQDLLRNRAADNLRELQAKVGKIQPTGVNPKKRWAPVQTGGAKGVGISKGGFSTEPIPLPGMAKVNPPTSIQTGLKKVKMGGVKGLAAGLISGGLTGVLKQNRKEKDEDFWGTYDTIATGLSMGLGLINPVAGVLAGPALELVGQWGNALVDNGYNPLGMKGEYDFYDDWVKYRKDPKNDGVSLPQYQQLRREAMKKMEEQYGTCTATGEDEPEAPASTVN